MAEASGADRLSTLPGPLLQLILSFLPSRDAVKTCVLARSWCHRWKSVPALRIADAQTSYANAQALNNFVNHLLLLRDNSPLRECEISSCDSDDIDDLDTFKYFELWIRYALSCQAQILRISNHDDEWHWWLPRMPLTSGHLTNVELYHVIADELFLDFSACTALQDLKMICCTLSTTKVSSPSLRRLSIRICHFNGDVRALISGPSLIYLELSGITGLTPFLQHMPSLASAFVRINKPMCFDWCENETGACGDLSCEGCRAGNGQINSCVFLNGLADSVHLELIADTKVFIFSKDLTWCPVFNKLRTLLVNEWCVTENLGALVYFLQHSPMLEKLTIQLGEAYGLPFSFWGIRFRSMIAFISKHDFNKMFHFIQTTHHVVVEPNQSYNQKEHFFVSKHLKVLEIRCYEEGELIQKIVKILSSVGVPPEKIDIRNYLWSSDSFSFEN